MLLSRRCWNPKFQVAWSRGRTGWKTNILAQQDSWGNALPSNRWRDKNSTTTSTAKVVVINTCHHVHLTWWKQGRCNNRKSCHLVLGKRLAQWLAHNHIEWHSRIEESGGYSCSLFSCVQGGCIVIPVTEQNHCSLTKPKGTTNSNTRSGKTSDWSKHLIDLIRV